MNIADKAKNFLRENRWTQAQLAQAIGVHPITLNNYLHQKFRKSTGERLLDFLVSQESMKESGLKDVEDECLHRRLPCQK